MKHSTGNVRLTEGEVARLYERRGNWEIDREALLKEAIANWLKRYPLASLCSVAARQPVDRDLAPSNVSRP
jgi:hypothetical protein